MPIVFREIGYAEGDYADDPYASPIVLAQMGLQFTGVHVFNLGLQFTAAIYNTNRLRTLCDFPSRGASVTGGGNNAWGNPKGTGQNWVASSTEPGDFSVYNLNTDIVEQVWRSATGVVTGVVLKVDTERTQGVFMDTFSGQNHNLTTSAVVIIDGSNDSTFATVGISIAVQVTDTNMYWLSPDLPAMGFRYWRISLDDPSNPDGFLSIGTIIFGAGRCMSGDQNTDTMDFSFKDFADKVPTEGFTNVANSRALKRQLSLEFRLISTLTNNFTILRDMITNDRTTHKCLWIPTPSATDQRVTDKYAIFSKISQLPKERHKYVADDKIYVDMTIDLDESL